MVALTARECVDCAAERERRGQPRPPSGNLRKIVAGGPRTPLCYSHDKQRKRERKANTAERRVKKIYGLADGDYGRMYLHQGRRCAICRRATGASRRLSVDHDHSTGLVRGLLCRPCNDFLGWIRDEADAGRRLFNYLTRPPAVELGIRAVHEDNRGEAP